MKNQTNVTKSKIEKKKQILSIETNSEDQNEKRKKKLESNMKKGDKSKRENCLNLQDIYKKYLKAS